MADPANWPDDPSYHYCPSESPYCGEDDKRDVPVLIKHYHKLGARFLEAAVDAKFNNTPGLLLRLDVPAMPERYIRTYLREGAAAYLAWGAPD